MRESQKSRLDVKLHTRIIDSIVRIQRWFRTILQRKKFLLLRSSAITIQSYWRMIISQKTSNINLQRQSAILIQSTWRMYITRKWYRKLCKGIIQIQSNIRGKRARVRYKGILRQKQLKERSKLRPTQSLPVNERSIDSGLGYYSPQASKLGLLSKPHHSVDSSDLVTKTYSLYPNCYNSTTGIDLDKRDVLNKAENQFRTLMISSGNTTGLYSNDEVSYF